MQLISLLAMPLVFAHMEMKSPAPRRSKYHPGYNNQDYDMPSPLGGQFKYPCRGFAAGPVANNYRAGSNIEVEIAPGTHHFGGHCQFALSFNGQDFVTIHTVFGTCPHPTRNFAVKIPENFPSGRAVFAWVWNNREGNRELYMNCADIEISGGSATSYTGHELLIANFEVPGKKVHHFPEGFKNNYGMALFEAQPNITISSSGTSNYPSSTRNNWYPKKQKKNRYPGFTPKPNKPKQGTKRGRRTKRRVPAYPNRPTYKKNPKQRPSFPKYGNIPTFPQSEAPKKVMPSKGCMEGGLYCNGNRLIGTCLWGNIKFGPCSQGTKCHEARPGQAFCVSSD